jgi:cell wall-associated NlpC family hydrolase
MAARLRLLVLALTLAYSLVFGPASLLASARKAPRQATARSKHRLHLRRQAPKPKPIGERAVAYARHLIGVPYRWGGSSPSSGFDCSGFVRYVYRRFGVQLPHSSYADFGLGRRVSRGALRAGDLVFFDGVGHVGMYVGGGRFIHAPHSGTRVQISTLAGYGRSYDGARRLVSGARRLLLHG